MNIPKLKSDKRAFRFGEQLGVPLLVIAFLSVPTLGCQSVTRKTSCDGGICEPVVIEAVSGDHAGDSSGNIRLAHLPIVSSRRHHAPEVDAGSISELIASPVEPIGPPNIVGTELQEPQTLASEKALRLQAENAELKSKLELLEADYARLQQQFASQADLLERMTNALGTAQQTLESAETSNQQLRQQLTDLEARRVREQRAAERELQSIQDDLNEVLMTELAQGGG